MSKLQNFIAVVFILLLLSFVSYNNAETNNSAPPQDISIDKNISGIAMVVDGDTIKVGENKIRLLIIDAPEHDQTCFKESAAELTEYRCGDMSTNFLKNLVDKKNVSCVYTAKDIYKRYLAECFLDKVSVNKEILKSGMGVIYSYSSADDEVKNLENYAKENKLGIWQGPFQLPKDFRKEQKSVRKKNKDELQKSAE
jgi:endonuclease YncB( thermonuclease family)